ncbi:MAG: NCS2 family permease [Clostridia bacterium]|nr:NCS2 family permease [Clostridia bacterium]
MEKLFKLKEHNTNVKTEIIAGLTTFFTMAYIIFVNPSMLGPDGPAKMPTVAVMTATCLAAALGTFLIGLLTNYPLAQAPGMGLNAVFAFTLCGQMGLSWTASLSAVFIAGIFFMLLTVSGFRQAMINAIPLQLKKAISAGIGMFIALIGFSNAGFLSSETGTIIGMASLKSPTTLLALFGLILAIILVVSKVPAALFISIIGTSIVGCICQFGLKIDMGLSLPTSWVPQVDFSTFGKAFFGFKEFFAAPIMAIVSVLITLVLVDMFDTVGTLIGAANKAGYLDKDGNLPKAEKAMFADATATAAGAILGTSTVTTYVESTAGISAGGKTALTSFVTAFCFLLSLVLSPLLGFVPAAATAPVLILVGVMMCSSLKEIEWNDIETAIPAFLTVFTMPIFYSITNGLAFGFISYTIIKAVRGKFKEIHPIMYVIVVLFIVKFVIENLPA